MFNNRELIQLLIERGQYITDLNFIKVEEVNDKITKLKNDKFANFTVPRSAFITFAYEDGYDMALKYCKKKVLK